MLKGAKEIWADYIQYLQTFLNITPDIINKIWGLLPKESWGFYQNNKGIFLSGLIQTSYRQGHNDFEFDEIGAHCFGIFLDGQENNPIRIKAKKVVGGEILAHSTHCFLKVEKLVGHQGSLRKANNSAIEIAKGNADEVSLDDLGESHDCKVYIQDKQLFVALKERFEKNYRREYGAKYQGEEIFHFGISQKK
ncbi:hypothetical protein HY643_01935 [Candidatus Woesearchaeota archaeon]|nr:hypothetical protein [Candidatus Woesearchaeota archaeon]